MNKIIIVKNNTKCILINKKNNGKNELMLKSDENKKLSYSKFKEILKEPDILLLENDTCIYTIRRKKFKTEIEIMNKKTRKIPNKKYFVTHRILKYIHFKKHNSCFKNIIHIREKNNTNKNLKTIFENIFEFLITEKMEGKSFEINNEEFENKLREIERFIANNIKNIEGEIKNILS